MICERSVFANSLAQNRNRADISLVALLKTCASENDLERGRRAHATALQTDSFGQNIFIGSALVSMYAKCGAMEVTWRVFDDLPVRNVVSWNALIIGFAHRGLGEAALMFFEEMRHEGVFPNSVTYLGILKACSAIGAAEKGMEVHDEMVRVGMLEKNILLGTALLDMYVKCGALARAQEVFDELPIWNAISWTALITGYCHHGYDQNALVCFDRMRHLGLSPDAVTFTCILKVCGSLGAIEKGVEVHEEILRNGMLGKDNVLCTALGDMYIKCGHLCKAQQMFDKLPNLDVVAWNALIAGYCQHGHCVKALNLFEKMRSEGFSPDLATLASILKACGSTAADENSQSYFENISQTYGLVPHTEHYTSMAYLFGCAGHFDKACIAITGMPVHEHLPSWVALLCACQRWGNIKVGGLVFERALEIRNPSAFLANSIFAVKCDDYG